MGSRQRPSGTPIHKSGAHRQGTNAVPRSNFANQRRTLRIERLEARELFAYAVGTIDLPPDFSAYAPEELTAGNDLLYFRTVGSDGDRPWRSDGTSEGTFSLLPDRSARNLTTVGDKLFFTSGYELWMSDGTRLGTSLIQRHNSTVSNLERVGNLVFYNVWSSALVMTLWRTDGTVQGTFAITPPIQFALPDQFELVDVNGIAFFTATDAITGVELWKSDGTIPGTSRVKDISAGAAGSEPRWLTNVNGTLFFSARSSTGRELWKSDGTDTGTRLVKDIYPVLENSDPGLLRQVGTKLMFTARSPGSSQGLWVSDGTTDGTQLLPGPPYSEFRMFLVVGGTLFYFNRFPNSSVDLWISDGTANGTRLIKRFDAAGGISADYGAWVSYQGDLFFTSDDGIHGSELWRSDGTEAGTRLAVELVEGPAALFPTSYRVVGERLYMRTGKVQFVDPRANTPSVTHAVTFAGVQSQSGLVVRRNAADGSEVSHLKVTDITRGTLFLHDGVTQVSDGDFVPFEETLLGLKFKPEESFIGTASIKVQASTSASDAGLGGNVVTATIAVLPGIGTAGDDRLTLRASMNGTMVEVYNSNPPAPGSAPIFTWPMDASVPLPIDTLAGNDAIFVELPAGSGGPAAGVRFERGAAADDLHVRNGRLRIGGGTSVIAGLAIDSGAALDIADNALVIDYAGTSPVATVRERILAGRGGAGFGAAWNGSGITSGAAAAANAVEPEAWSVAYAENAAMPLGAYTSFRGQAVDASSVLIAYTRTGDANLDGVVNDDDVTIVGAAYAPGVPQPQWALGDFDYNGFVDDDDVTLLGAFYAPPAAAKDEVRITKDEMIAAVGPPPAAQYEGRISSDRGRAADEMGATIAAEETLGRSGVRGRETRAQLVGQARAEDESTRDDEALVDLLAESIAADAAGRSDGLYENGIALRQIVSDHEPQWLFTAARR